MDVEPALDDRHQHVVGGVDVVVDRVALVQRRLHRIGRGALLGEVDDGVGPPVAEQRQQPVVVLRDVDPVERRSSVPDTSRHAGEPLAHRPDRGQARDLELVVDVAPRQIVDDRDLVAARRQMQRRRPAAEPVAAQDDHPHGASFVADAALHRTAAARRTTGAPRLERPAARRTGRAAAAGGRPGR